MTVRIIVIMLVTMLAAGNARSAIDPLPDVLSAAYYAAERDLQAGKDRKEIAERLRPVVEKNTTSVYYKLSSEFLADLVESAKNPPKADAGADKKLRETRIALYLVTVADNRGGPLQDYLKKNPKDPACELLLADRTAIDRLIPLLTDRSPTQSDNPRFVSGSGLNPQPRVCDVALAIIEYLSYCRFYHDTIHGSVLHQLSEARREEVVTRVQEWWKENKDKPVTAGVRAQIPHAKSYPEKVWMAKTLIRLGDGKKSDDKEFGLNVLRDMVKANPRSHVAAYAADALAEAGDTSAVDIFYTEWKSWLGRPGLMHDPHIAFYLCTHGKRREWELLHAIAVEELRDAKASAGGEVWACVLNSPSATTNPYAVPILAQALAYKDRITSQPYSYAERALVALQKQVGKDLDYKPGAVEEDRKMAIHRAQQWWDDEGKAKYTFDNIEKNLVRK